MSKQSKIRWGNKDTEQLKNAITDFNNKISKVSKSNKLIAPYLPNKLNVNDIKKQVISRQDLNRVLSSLKRINKDDSLDIITNSKGVTITKYELRETINKNRISNIKKAYQRKALDVSPYKGNMGTIENNNLNYKAFNFNNKSQKEWDKFIEALDNQVKSNYFTEKLDQYKQNYIKAIENVYGYSGQELIDIIQSIDSYDVFMDGINDPTLFIDFIYDKIEADIKLEYIIDGWNEIIDSIG
jgi:hypothetical protein